MAGCSSASEPTIISPSMTASTIASMMHIDDHRAIVPRTSFFARTRAAPMKLTPPSFPSWLFAVLFGVAGIAGKYGFFAAAAPHAFLLVMIAFLILLAATLFAGL
jgi:hypothetical protein